MDEAITSRGPSSSSESTVAFIGIQICRSERKCAGNFDDSVLTRSDFTCSTIRSRTAAGNKIDDRCVNFRRRGERPAFLPVARDNLRDFIRQLLMNAAVGFSFELRPLGDGTCSTMSARAVRTGNRPAKSVTLSTSRPCASVISNACTSCKLGPRVGVSFTRYAFKLPRSVTMMREVGVMANR